MPQLEPGLVKKCSMIVIGGTLVLLGLLTFWLPLPIGLPLMLLGGALLIRYSPNARRWWRDNKNRLPFARLRRQR